MNVLLTMNGRRSPPQANIESPDTSGTISLINKSSAYKCRKCLKKNRPCTTSGGLQCCCVRRQPDLYKLSTVTNDRLIDAVCPIHKPTAMTSRYLCLPWSTEWTARCCDVTLFTPLAAGRSSLRLGVCVCVCVCVWHLAKWYRLTGLFFVYRNWAVGPLMRLFTPPSLL